MSIFTRAPHTPSICSVSERVLREIHEGIRDGDGDNPHSGGIAMASHEEKERAPLRRIVVRDMPFHQSSNSLRIRHQISPRSRGPMNVRFWYFPDWFHVFLRLRTEVSILLFIALWTALIVIFAGLYYGVDLRDIDISCGLGPAGDPISFHGAFAFSLETATTVGYGIPNGGNFFFENCPSLQVTIYFQMVITLFLNAFIISFVYSRMSRSETRATQFLFSQKATLNREVTSSGIVRYALSVRLFDADSMYPLMEAHVRFYAVKHGDMHAPENVGVLFPVKMEPMRVSIPNDDLGADLYTSMPMSATHYIDHHSPINPPARRAAGPEDGRVNPGSGFVTDYCDMMLRENDAYTNGRDGLRCAICGETFATVANLVQHIRYYQFSERHDSLPIVGSHQELDVEGLFKGRSTDHNTSGKVIRKEGSEAAATADAKINIDHGPGPLYDEFRRYYERANVEIICVVEAIDPILSGTFHAVQSYTIDDIVCDAEFAPCVLADASSKNRSWWVNRSAAGCSMKAGEHDASISLLHGAFMQRWNKLEDPYRECQEVMKLPPASSGIDEGYMDRVANIIAVGLKFGRCQGVDPTPWTVSGAATFRMGTKDMNGNNINVGCLLRIEANPKANAFRVTTRTLHPLCSKAIKNAVVLVSIKLTPKRTTLECVVN